MRSLPVTGSTLVIDTVGIKVGPFAIVDMYGTPHTDALHVVERYRLLDSQATNQAEDRGEKENFRLQVVDSRLARNPDRSIRRHRQTRLAGTSCTTSPSWRKRLQSLVPRDLASWQQSISRLTVASTLTNPRHRIIRYF